VYNYVSFIRLRQPGAGTQQLCSVTAPEWQLWPGSTMPAWRDQWHRERQGAFQGTYSTEPARLTQLLENTQSYYFSTVTFPPHLLL
jgi:hypothetical protein